MRSFETESVFALNMSVFCHSGKAKFHADFLSAHVWEVAGPDTCLSPEQADPAQRPAPNRIITIPSN